MVDGRNVWINDLGASLATLREVGAAVGDDRLIAGTSCSLLHVPLELELETGLDPELRSGLAFANQKSRRGRHARPRLRQPGAAADELAANRAALESRRNSPRTHDPAVRERVAATSEDDYSRDGSVEERRQASASGCGCRSSRRRKIGSFPQTPEIRRARRRRNSGEIDDAEYETFIEAEIERVIRLQEETGLDLLVHGESERNDMVEYFGEQLAGFAFTRFGWVQSYGSRNVKPPIILRRRRAARPDDRALVRLRAVADGPPGEGHAHRAGHDPQLVVRARRPAA